jgi:hypothetical protein
MCEGRGHGQAVALPGPRQQLASGGAKGPRRALGARQRWRRSLLVALVAVGAWLPRVVQLLGGGDGVERQLGLVGVANQKVLAWGGEEPVACMRFGRGRG